MVTSRTIGPLHLEDLEPHRFEDLIRQLIYDFRSWRTLEAVGRMGSDEGFDARAIEIVGSKKSEDPETGEESDDSEEVGDSLPNDRVWLVQCKREKAISPKKLNEYLDAIPVNEDQGLYGVIFAAACDFSKASRDLFRGKVRDLGVAEAYLWGKAEIEDMLFQPKNDHLLFAYFGISLQTRRRTLKTEVRSRLAAKRKALRYLPLHTTALIRDATDDRYPYVDEDKTKSGIDRGRWIMRTYLGCFWDGLHFLCARHFAYISDDGQEWDFAETMNDALARGYENPWREDEEVDFTARSKAYDIWFALPEQNRAWFEVEAIMPYESIIDLDQKGDDWTGVPHIFTTEFEAERGPFRSYLIKLEGGPSTDKPRDLDSMKRVQKFTREE